MAEGLDRAGRAQPGRGGWPAWLDEDDFDSLGKNAWLAAMESLAEEGPEPECPPDPSVPDGGPAAGAPADFGHEGGFPEGGFPEDDGLPDDGLPGDRGLPGDPDWPVLGFGPGEAGDSMAPGVSLGMLAEHAVTGGGLAVMSDAEVVGLIGGARRLRCRAQWLELRGTREFARRRWESGAEPVRDGNGRWLFRNSPAEMAADELAFHLTDSRAQAEDRMELSLALWARLPRMDELLSLGRLDERLVQGVADITSGLTDEQARRVDEMLAPDAPGLGYTALRRRAAKLAMALSPEAERRRKERATRRKARVEKFQEKSGNYALAVREMPVEEILASEQHIRGLASWLRRHGVKLGQREAEVMVYLDLTQGRDPLDRIPPARRNHAASSSPNDRSGSGGCRGSDSGRGSNGDGRVGGGRDHPDEPKPAGEPESARRDPQDDEGQRDNEGQDNEGQRDDEGQDGEGRQRDEGWRDEGQQDDEGWRDGPWDDWDDEDEGDDQDGGGDGGGGGRGPWPFSPPGPAKPGGRAPFAATINLLVPAGTAFGWSTMPGEAARDIIDPQTLRDMMQAASRHPKTRWCVTLVGEDGTAVAHGCARGRHTWDPRPGLDGITAAGTGPGRQPAPAQAAALAEFLARLKVTADPIAKGTCDHRHAEPR